MSYILNNILLKHNYIGSAQKYLVEYVKISAGWLEILIKSYNKLSLMHIHKHGAGFTMISFSHYGSKIVNVQKFSSHPDLFQSFVHHPLLQVIIFEGPLPIGGTKSCMFTFYTSCIYSENG